MSTSSSADKSLQPDGRNDTGSATDSGYKPEKQRATQR